jgi:predicted GNAT family acetyltransferase
MTSQYRVEREDHTTRGRYVVHLPDGSEAEMTYRKPRPGVLAIDHTGVPVPFRNSGIALMLVEAGIADARRDGSRIIPLCSYVAAQFRRHPEWEDLRAEA